MKAIHNGLHIIVKETSHGTLLFSIRGGLEGQSINFIIVGTYVKEKKKHRRYILRPSGSQRGIKFSSSFGKIRG